MIVQRKHSMNWFDIPQGIRVVIRVHDGQDSLTGRMQFRDYVGHVQRVVADDTGEPIIYLTRDAAANGSRPEENVAISTSNIVAIKPIPERPQTQHSR